MRIAIVGSRNWDYLHIVSRTVQYLHFINPDNLFVSGRGGNVDLCAEEEAKKLHLSTVIFPAQWNRHGKAAGPIRNERIVEACTAILFFWDGTSIGTRGTIDLAVAYKRPYLIIKPDHMDQFRQEWEYIKTFLRKQYTDEHH